MTTTDVQKMSDSTIAAASPSAAYIQWMCEAPFTGWNSDPTQPCLLYKIYRDVPRVLLDRRIPLHLLSCAQTDPTAEQKLAWLLYYTHGLTRVMRPAPGSLLALPPAHCGNEELPSLPRTYSGPQP